MLTGEDGRAVLEIICAAYLSARTGQRIALADARLDRNRKPSSSGLAISHLFVTRQRVRTAYN